MKKVLLAFTILAILAVSAVAGMDSAGTTSLGTYTETDVLTHGGDVKTGGGDLDLENGNLQGVDDFNANSVTTTSVDTTTLDASSVSTSEISNSEGNSVRISDNVEMTGGSITGVTSVQVTKTTPTLANEATSKAYVDQVAEDLKKWAETNLSSTTTVTNPPTKIYWCTCPSKPEDNRSSSSNLTGSGCNYRNTMSGLSAQDRFSCG